MAEAKDILSLLQFNLPEGKELKDVDTSEIETHFKENFIGMNVAAENDTIKNKILGKEIGSLSTKAKNMFESAGVNFEGKEIKEDGRIMIDKVYEVGFAELTGQLKTLKESSGKTNDKQISDLTTKIESLQSDYTTVLKERDGLKQSVDEKDKFHNEFVSGLELRTRLSKAKKNIQFSDTADKYAKIGFDVDFNNKYEVALSDENDSEDGLRIVSKETKQRISEGNKFVTYENLYKKELMEAKLLKVAEQKQEKKVFNYQQQNGNKEVKISSFAEQIAAGETNV